MCLSVLSPGLNDKRGEAFVGALAHDLVAEIRAGSAIRMWQ